MPGSPDFPKRLFCENARTQMTRSLLPYFVIITLVSLGVYGCSSSTTTKPATPDTPTATEDHSGHDHGEHAGHDDGGQTDMEKMKAELAKLSPEDAASAEQQHMCPVTGEMLGTMGAPQKVDVEGQQVWICCSGCKDKLLADPDEYLAKIKKE
jgi:Cu(I)/Ag(I) efflux system membrane fusion protein